MRDIKTPKNALVWKKKMKCGNCGTKFVAETSDLDYGGFKKPGTYFFDGSADSAGYNYYYFVCCPTDGCRELRVVADEEVPPLLRIALIKKNDDYGKNISGNGKTWVAREE